jgi:S1-C subfamily serine protease
MAAGAPRPFFILMRRHLPVRVDRRRITLVGETYMKRVAQSVLIVVWISGGPSIAAIIGVASQTGAKVLAGQRRPAPDISPEEKIKPLIVMLTAKFSDPDEEMFGAGIIFGLGIDRIYIATANHLVRKGQQEAQSLRVRFKRLPGEEIEAKLLKDAAPELDLAVLAVENLARLGKLPFGPFDQLGDPSSLKRGDSLYSVGNPRGRQWYLNVTPDKVAGKSGSEISFEAAFIEPGHSGGALLDERMEMVGMIKASNPPEGVAANIQSVLDTLKQWGYPVSLMRRQYSSKPMPSETTIAKAGAVFTTPEAAVETFLAAAATRDLDQLSQCFSDKAPGEWDGLRNKTAGKQELDQLAEFVQGARVGNAKVSPDGIAATVPVRFKARDEIINMIKTVNGWRIVDF